MVVIRLLVLQFELFFFDGLKPLFKKIVQFEEGKVHFLTPTITQLISAIAQIVEVWAMSAMALAC